MVKKPQNLNFYKHCRDIKARMPLGTENQSKSWDSQLKRFKTESEKWYEQQGKEGSFVFIEAVGDVVRNRIIVVEGSGEKIGWIQQIQSYVKFLRDHTPGCDSIGD